MPRCYPLSFLSNCSFNQRNCAKNVSNIMSGPIAIEIHVNVFETWPFLKDPKESAVIIQSGLSVSVFPSLCHMLEFSTFYLSTVECVGNALIHTHTGTHEYECTFTRSSSELYYVSSFCVFIFCCCVCDRDLQSHTM